MDIRIKELVAIGASIGANCLPCLEYHVNKATANNVTEEDINAAIEMGKLVRKGAEGKMDQLMDKLSGCPATADSGCGCS